VDHIAQLWDETPLGMTHGPMTFQQWVSPTLAEVGLAAKGKFLHGDVMAAPNTLSLTACHLLQVDDHNPDSDSFPRLSHI